MLLPDFRSPRRFPPGFRPRAPPPFASRPPVPLPSRAAPRSRPLPRPVRPVPAAPVPIPPRAARGPVRPRRRPGIAAPVRRAAAGGGRRAARAAARRSLPRARAAPAPAPGGGRRAHEKTPCPGQGQGAGIIAGRDRREAYALPFAARASAPFAVANSAHRVTASGFSNIHARRYAHSAGSPEMPRVGWCRPCASFQKRLL